MPTPHTTESPSVDRRTFLAGLSGAVAGGAVASQFQTTARAQATTSPAANAIAYIVDGMGQTQISAARYLNAYKTAPERFPLNVSPAETPTGFDAFSSRGSMTTFPDDPYETTTDSAAAATAFASGVKTYNGAIGGVRTSGSGFQRVDTVLERASAQGYATGLITTTEATHATPAAFAAHVEDRGNQTEIARQYIEETQPDVIFGGQRRDFEADASNGGTLVDAARDNGYTIAETAAELDAVDDPPVLGLFSQESHLDYYLDRENDPENTQPNLDAMVDAGVELLSSAGDPDKGFFLLVESGRVDHAGHANYPAQVAEQYEATQVAGQLVEYAETTAEPTFLVSTGDHECGGLTLGRDSPYEVEYDVLAAQKATTSRLRDLLAGVRSADELESIVAAHTGITALTDREVAKLRDAPGSISTILAERAGIAFTTDGHTGTDVPVFAHGPNAARFDAARDNTAVADALAAALGVSL